MANLYEQLVYGDAMAILSDWGNNNCTPLLRTVWYKNRNFDPKQDEWKAEYKLVGYNAGWACVVEDPDKTGWHSMKFNWEQDSQWLTIFNRSHLEYHNLITLKEGTPIIVAFPDKKEAYKATFKMHAMCNGYGHYVDVVLENGEEQELHCLEYEGDWICFLAD